MLYAAVCKNSRRTESLYHAGQSGAPWYCSRKQFVFIHGTRGRAAARDTERRGLFRTALCLRERSGGGGGVRASFCFSWVLLTHVCSAFSPLNLSYFKGKLWLICCPGLQPYYLMLVPNDWKGFSTSIGREERESSLRNRCYVLLHLFFLYAVLFIVFRLPKCENLERTDDDDDDGDGDDAGQFGTTSHREFRCRGCGQPPGSGSALDDATRPTPLPPPPRLPKQKAIIHQGGLRSFLSSLLMHLHLGVRHAFHCPHLAWPSCPWRMNQRPSHIPVRWPGGLPCGKRARLLCNSRIGSLELTSPPGF